MIKPGDEPIPGYRIEQFLGQGKFGQVWRATGPGSTLVALKFLDLQGLHAWKEFRAVQRVKQIRHAHLMPILALWLLDGEGNVVSDDVLDDIASRESTSAATSSSTSPPTSPHSETLVINPQENVGKPSLMVVATLLANRSLADRLKEARDEGRQGVPSDEVLGYVTEAAKALDFLNLSQHKIGDSEGSIQHCDVKPDNILLIGGSVVLADWGVAQLLAGQQTSATATSLGGTPAYMPPECFKNTPCHSSDQYSLAVTYYELRTGQLPFFEETYAAVFEAHRSGSLDFSAVGAAEQRTLRRATSVDPNKRFDSCGDFVAALSDSASTTASAPASRHKVYLTVAAVVAVLAVASIALVPGFLPVPEKTARIVIDVDPADATLVVSAEHHATTADRLLKDGNFEGAVQELTRAIKLDSETYARSPPPHLTETSGEAGAIVDLKFSQDGRWLLSGTKSGSLRRFPFADNRLSKGREVHALDDRIKKIIVRKSWVAAICNEGNKIWLAPTDDLARGKELPAPEDLGRIVDVVITGDENWLVAAMEDYLMGEDDSLADYACYVYAWDLNARSIDATGQEVFRAEKEMEPTLAAGQAAPAGQAGPWIVLATYATKEKSCVVRQCWIESKTKRRLYVKRGEKGEIAVGGREDRLIAISGERFGSATDKHGITLVDVNLKTDSAQDLPWGHASVAQLAWNSAGDRLVSSDHNGDMHVWKIPADFRVDEQIDTAPVFFYAQSADTNRRRHLTGDGFRCFATGWLLCRYGNGELTLWNSELNSDQSRPQAMPLEFAGPVSAIAVSGNGKWIAAGGVAKGSEASFIGIWSGDQLRLIKCAREAAEIIPKRDPTAPPDPITLRGLPFRPDCHSLWGSTGIASFSLDRPNVKPA